MNAAAQFDFVSTPSSDPLIDASLFPRQSQDQPIQGSIFSLRLKGVAPRYDAQSALVELSHPALLRILRFQAHNGETSIFMEAFEGRSLQSSLDDNQMFTIDRVFSMLRQIAAGLDAIHAAGFIHSCLRPASIFIGALNQIKIVDLAVDYQNAPPETLLPVAHHLSPEYLEGTPTGPYTDCFSLACLAYRLIYQRDPFKRSSLIEELFCISAGHWDRHATDPAVKTVFEKALSPVPEMRYQGSIAMIEALEAAWKADISAPTRLSENSFRPPTLADSAAPVEASSKFKQWLVSPRGGIVAAWTTAIGCTLATCILGFACVALQQSITRNRTQTDLLKRETEDGPSTPGLRNGMMTLCNSSSDPVEVLDLSSTYWDQTQHLHTFNSAAHPHLNWQLSPSSGTTLSQAQGDTNPWDGSVAFYSMKLRYRGKDYLTSGVWRRFDGTCMQLAK